MSMMKKAAAAASILGTLFSNSSDSTMKNYAKASHNASRASTERSLNSHAKMSRTPSRHRRK